MPLPPSETLLHKKIVPRDIRLGLAAFYGGHRDILRNFVSISSDEAKSAKFRLPKPTRLYREPYASKIGGGRGGRRHKRHRTKAR